MTPRQVLEAILTALEHSKWVTAQLSTQAYIDYSSVERYRGQATGLSHAIELVRLHGKGILHASDLTQQDEKETT